MNLAVLGAQWGDEGKGKIVDLLAPRFDIVARYQGGHNAGHTVHVSGRKFVLRLLPSGILHSGVMCVIGNGVVVDLAALFSEIDQIEALGVTVGDRLVVSNRAHLVLPYHRELDALSEAHRGTRRIGTTSRGIGPAYEDKVARRGLRVGDLADPSSAAAVAETIRDNVEARNRVIADSQMNWREVLDQVRDLWPRLQPMVRDVSVFLDEARRNGKSVLYEGAQGTLLDIDHGTYPYVTSSNATAGGICTGLGVGPSAIDAVVGVTKAYTTRVGDGPLPTELHDAMGEALRRRGHEFGAVTGRPRRCGWFDALVVRHAARVNGLDALALTKMDVLDGIDEIRVCTAYRVGGQVVREFPAQLAALVEAQPIYETVAGWRTPTAGARDFASLPREAASYLARIEDLVGVPIALVSTGPDRDETIVRADSVLAPVMTPVGPRS